MVRYPTPVLASCTCGAVNVRITGALTRFFCHCSICQRVNQAPFGDPVFLFRWDQKVEDATQLSWKRYRWTPVNLNRGTCRTCGMLMVEHVAASPLSVVVGRTWSEPERLPAALGHVFYDSRAADVDDGLPKWSRYFPSEFAITKWVAQGLMTRPQLPVSE